MRLIPIKIQTVSQNNFNAMNKLYVNRFVYYNCNCFTISSLNVQQLKVLGVQLSKVKSNIKVVETKNRNFL